MLLAHAVPVRAGRRGLCGVTVLSSHLRRTSFAAGFGPEGPLPVDKMKSIAVPVTRRSASNKLRRAGHPQMPPDEGLIAQVATLPRQRVITASIPTKPTPKHRYHVGQRLRLLGGGNYWARNSGTCRVIMLMPYEGGGLFYRVRNETENFERVVAEGDLSTLATAP
jgi:hypothetical protein